VFSIYSIYIFFIRRAQQSVPIECVLIRTCSLYILYIYYLSGAPSSPCAKEAGADKKTRERESGRARERESERLPPLPPTQRAAQGDKVCSAASEGAVGGGGAGFGGGGGGGAGGGGGGGEGGGGGGGGGGGVAIRPAEGH